MNSAVELADAIARRDVSSYEVVEAHLDRIDDINGEVNALVSLRGRNDVLADASLADASTHDRGPLHGLPIAVKDLQHVAGLPTRSGSLVSSSRPHARDGHLASKLRTAGAIIVGKTNTPEFGTGSHTFNEVFGITRNPWNLSRTAGGSSGGAAAALASRMVPIADGSDLGGSLRNPAALCNVVGLRPSVGRVADPDAATTYPRLGVNGPMGRTVADAALLLSALAGPHRRDPLSLPETGAMFSPPFEAETTARLGWGGDLGAFTTEAEVLSVAEAASRSVLAAGGTWASEAPEMNAAETVFRVLRGVAYARLGAEIPEDRHRLLKQTVRDNIAYGRSLTVGDLNQAETKRAELHRTMSDFFDEFDVLALPTTQVTPFPVDVEYPTQIEGVEMSDYLGWMMSACMITATGCPAISIPAGFTSDGLPVGLQLVARMGHDRQLLEIAAAIEAANPHFERCPTV